MGDQCVYDLFNVLLDDEYGLRDLPDNPSVIVDVGVNMGIFSLAAWAKFPHAKIFGYEPGPAAFKISTCNLESTGTILFNEAVGLESGMCDISDCSQSRLAKAVVSDTGSTPVIPFSEVLKRAGGMIDLLKMDCEGAEWDILKDCESMRYVRSIRMEYHLDRKQSLNDFKELVAAGDLQIVKLIANGNHGIAWLENKHLV